MTTSWLQSPFQPWTGSPAEGQPLQLLRMCGRLCPAQCHCCRCCCCSRHADTWIQPSVEQRAVLLWCTGSPVPVLCRPALLQPYQNLQEGLQDLTLYPRQDTAIPGMQDVQYAARLLSTASTAAKRSAVNLPRPPPNKRRLRPRAASAPSLTERRIGCCVCGCTGGTP